MHKSNADGQGECTILGALGPNSINLKCIVRHRGLVQKWGFMTFQRTCKSCSSQDQHSFHGEIAIHFPGLDGLNKPIVWVFPELLVCLNCGLAEFMVPDEQRNILRNPESGDEWQGSAAAA